MNADVSHIEVPNSLLFPGYTSKCYLIFQRVLGCVYSVLRLKTLSQSKP